MKFTEIRKQVVAENETYCKNVLDAIKTREEILQRESTKTRWTQYQNNEISREELEAFTSERIKRKYRKQTAQELERLTEIENAESPEEIVIRVDWIKSKTGGYNPHAEITDDVRKWYGSASGCGYDKRTAAIAQAANQSNRILHILAEKKESALKHGEIGSNHDLIGYGSGYSAIPKLEGGVGISNFRNIFERCGYEWKDYSGTTYDLYILTKKESEA